MVPITTLDIFVHPTDVPGTDAVAPYRMTLTQYRCGVVTATLPTPDGTPQEHRIEDRQGAFTLLSRLFATAYAPVAAPA